MHRRAFLRIVGAAAIAPSLAYAADHDPTILGDLQRLTPGGGGDNRATYMPDGRSLLFASRRTGKSQIWTMQLDGGGARRFHESTSNDYGRVAPSPDGSRLS